MSDQAPASAPAPEAAAPSAANQEQSLESLEQEVSEAEAAAPAAESKPDAIKADAKAAADKLDAEKIQGTKKYKIVTDGIEEEVTEKELIAMAQKGKSSDKRFQEASQIKKEAKQLLEMVKNPEQLEELLADPAIWGDQRKVVEFAQKVLAKQLENEQKSPELLRAEKAEKELQAHRDQQKKEQEEREKADYENFVNTQAAQMETQIVEAIESSGMPKSPFVLKRVAQVLQSALQQDKQISPKQAMSIARREMEKDLKEFFEVAPDEVMESLINAEKIRALRNRQLSKIKAAQKAAPDAPSKAKDVAEGSSTPKKTEKVSMRDFLRRK